MTRATRFWIFGEVLKVFLKFEAFEHLPWDDNLAPLPDLTDPFLTGGAVKGRRPPSAPLARLGIARDPRSAWPDTMKTAPGALEIWPFNVC